MTINVPLTPICARARHDGDKRNVTVSQRVNRSHFTANVAIAVSPMIADNRVNLVPDLDAVKIYHRRNVRSFVPVVNTP